MLFRTLILLGAMMGRSIALPTNDTITDLIIPGDRCGDPLIHNETTVHHLRIEKPNQDNSVTVSASEDNPAVSFGYDSCMVSSRATRLEDLRATYNNDIADLIDTPIGKFAKADKIGSRA